MTKEQYLITRVKKKESQPTSSSAPYNPKELQILKGEHTRGLGWDKVYVVTDRIFQALAYLHLYEKL